MGILNGFCLTYTSTYTIPRTFSIIQLPSFKHLMALIPSGCKPCGTDLVEWRDKFQDLQLTSSCCIYMSKCLSIRTMFNNTSNSCIETTLFYLENYSRHRISTLSTHSHMLSVIAEVSFYFQVINNRVLWRRLFFPRIHTIYAKAFT